MLKAKLNRADEPLYVIGLSAENIKRLQENQPILFLLNELGIPGGGEILIMAGKTEATIAQQLEKSGLLPPGSAERAAQASAKPARHQTT